MALPIYQEQYKEAGLPSPRMSGFDADAYGAQVWRGVQGFGDALRVKIEEFEDAETLEAINNFRREMDTYHQDPTKGILNLRQGKNAMNLANDSLQYMTDKQTEYMSKFASQRQRNNFERMSHDYIDRRHSSNMNFETQNIDKYELEQAQANIELHSDAIMGCIGAETNADYESHLGAIDESIVFMARKYGWSDEQLEAAVRATRDKATINRLQAWADKDWESAYEWYSGTARQSIPNYGVVSSYAYGGTAGSMKPGQYVGGHTALQGGTEGLISQYDNYIKQYANVSGVDPNLVRAVMYCESGGKSNSVSSAGARGLMQLMPDTAKGLGVDPDDPEQNIRGGVAYLAQMLQQQGGDVELALAAYNAGPGNVKKHGGIPPFKETQNYVKKVMSKYREYTKLGGGKEYIGDGVRGTAEGLTSMITGGTVLTQTSEFGVDRGTHKHGGYDYAASVGTKLYAPTTSDSFVLNYGYDPKGYGHWVSLKDENGIEWRYAHLSAPTRDLPEKGAIVRPGDLVALSGNSGRSTGPHVHVEVLKDGEKINPYDYLGGRKGGTPAMFNVPRLPREDGKGIRATLSSAAREKLDDYFETFEAQQIARSMMADSHYSSPTGLADGRDVLDTAIMDASLKEKAIKAYQNEWTNASTRRVALKREQAKAQNAVYEGYQLSMANGRYPTVEEVMSANMDAGQKATIINAINREIASADKEAQIKAANDAFNNYNLAMEMGEIINPYTILGDPNLTDEQKTQLVHKANSLAESEMNDALALEAARAKEIAKMGDEDVARLYVPDFDLLMPDEREKVLYEINMIRRTGKDLAQEHNERAVAWIGDRVLRGGVTKDALTRYVKDGYITNSQKDQFVKVIDHLEEETKLANKLMFDQFDSMFVGKDSELANAWNNKLPVGYERMIDGAKARLRAGLLKISESGEADKNNLRKVLFDNNIDLLKAEIASAAVAQGMAVPERVEAKYYLPHPVSGPRTVPVRSTLSQHDLVFDPEAGVFKRVYKNGDGGVGQEVVRSWSRGERDTLYGELMRESNIALPTSGLTTATSGGTELGLVGALDFGKVTPYTLSKSMFGRSNAATFHGEDGSITIRPNNGEFIRAIPELDGMRITRSIRRPDTKEGDYVTFEGEFQGIGEVEVTISNLGGIAYDAGEFISAGAMIGKARDNIRINAKVDGKEADVLDVFNQISQSSALPYNYIMHLSNMNQADVDALPDEIKLRVLDLQNAIGGLK